MSYKLPQSWSSAIAAQIFWFTTRCFNKNQNKLPQPVTTEARRKQKWYWMWSTINFPLFEDWDSNETEVEDRINGIFWLYNCNTPYLAFHFSCKSCSYSSRYGLLIYPFYKQRLTGWISKWLGSESTSFCYNHFVT